MRAENVARRGRIEEYGASAPNDTVARWSFRRKEKTLYGVPKAPRVAGLRGCRDLRGCRLRSNVRQDDLRGCRPRSNDRHNSSEDQIPLSIDRDWNDWLYVERVLPALERSKATVIIALKRNADKAGNRVRQFLGKLLTVLLCKSRGAAARCKDPQKVAPKGSPPPQAIPSHAIGPARLIPVPPACARS